MNATEVSPRIFRRAVWLAVALSGLGSSLHATGSSFPAANAVPEAAVELRGVLSIGGVTRFRICEPAANRAAWLSVGEHWGDVVVDAYEVASGSVTVERAGTKLVLTLPKGSITAAVGSEFSPPFKLSTLNPQLSTPPSAPLDIAAESRAHGIVRR